MRVLLVSVLLALVAGCAQLPGADPEPLVYQCGKGQLTATFEQRSVTVDYGDESRHLAQVKAASGSKYQDESGDNMLWQKGSDALVRWQGQSLPSCTQQGTLPEQLAVRGNEPFWLATLSGETLDLTTPEAEQQYRVTDKQVTGSNPETWEVNTNSDVSLIIRRQLCHDSMSGKAYPFQVSLARADGQHPGCGGETKNLLQGVTWRVTEPLQGVATATKAATLSFLADGKLAGFDGCNRFFGRYSVAGETPRLQVMGGTKMMCPAAAMEYSAAVTELLNNVLKIDITEKAITITAESGQQLVLTPSEH